MLIYSLSYIPSFFTKETPNLCIHGSYCGLSCPLLSPHSTQKCSLIISLRSVVPFCYPWHTCNMTHPPPIGFHPPPSLCFHSVIHNYSVFYAPSFSTPLTLILGTKVPPLWAAMREQQGNHIWPFLNLSHIVFFSSLECLSVAPCMQNCYSFCSLLHFLNFFEFRNSGIYFH